jgi:hypothetical protein
VNLNISTTIINKESNEIFINGPLTVPSLRLDKIGFPLQNQTIYGLLNIPKMESMRYAKGMSTPIEKPNAEK